MLIATRLQKSYEAHRKAVDGVSFEAARGELVGLLGPNGAGKTTTISMVAGLLRPDAGEVRIDGAAIDSDVSPAKRKLGFVPQDLALYEELTAKQNLTLFGALYGVTDGPAKNAIDRVLTLTGLRDRAKDKVETFSGGMKRRLNLAAALLHDPQVLLLDEPTVGVDPQSRNAIFDNLETLKAEGKTILYTTHYMEEAERLCDRIVIVDHGKAVANDDLAGLLRLLPSSGTLEVALLDDPPPREQIENLPGVLSVDLNRRQLQLALPGFDAIPEVLSGLARLGCRVEHVNTSRPTLESVFLHLTGRSLRDA